MNAVFIAALILNTTSSVGLIFLNKALFSIYRWNYATSLTTLHFLVNYLVCEMIFCFGYANRKLLPWKEAIPMGAAWCGSIVFANFSLLANSTGYYQSMKLLLAPLLVVWQYTFFGIKTDSRERNALIPLLFGVGLITVNDICATSIGTFWAVSQLLCAAAVQTWAKTKQKAHDMDATQILHNNSFVCFAIMAPIAPILDYSLVGGWVHEHEYKASLGAIIILSALVAMLLNLACFVIIGFKGPIAFQVVGYLKTVLVFTGGNLFFNDHYEHKKICGVVTAIFGLIYYTHIKSIVDAEKSGLGKSRPVSKSTVEQSEVKILLEEEDSDLEVEK